MKSTYKLKITELPDTKFGALATPDAFMGIPLEIWYDPEYDIFWQRYRVDGWIYRAQEDLEAAGMLYITTIRPVTDAYRDQRLAEIEEMYREYWASCT